MADNDDQQQQKKRQAVLRARLAGLARSAKTAGADISAAGRRGFQARFTTQARELVEARLAKGEVIDGVEQEVERVAAVLMRRHMIDLANRPRKPRKSKGAKPAPPPHTPTTVTTATTAKAEEEHPALGNPLPRSRYVPGAQPPTITQQRSDTHDSDPDGDNDSHP